MNSRPLRSLVAALACCLSVSCSFLTTGCATLTAEDKALVIQYATAKAVVEILEGDAKRAERVIVIAGAVREFAGTEQVESVALLEAFIRSKIDWSKLDALDTRLANRLLGRITTRLEEKIGTGPITGAKLLVVAEVADWIEDAARTVHAKA